MASPSRLVIFGTLLYARPKCPFTAGMAEAQAEARARRRAAIRAAYEAVTTGERVALTSRVDVPAVLLERFHPSVGPSI
jgi:hypothetical protein